NRRLETASTRLDRQFAIPKRRPCSGVVELAMKREDQVDVVHERFPAFIVEDQAGSVSFALDLQDLRRIEVADVVDQESLLERRADIAERHLMHLVCRQLLDQ